MSMVREPLDEVEPREVAGASPHTLPAAHRRSNLGLTAALLGLWLVVSFVPVFFARDLDFDFFGWPFGFWVAAQGAPIAYLAITGFYAWALKRLDARHGVGDESDPA